MSLADTSIGGPRRAFPTTVWSDIVAAGDPFSPQHAERLERLLRSYWKPVFAYVRTVWRKSVEEAKDLTQAFFADLLEKRSIAGFRPERASFRRYLKHALKYYLIDVRRAAARRPADHAPLSLQASREELERLGPMAPDDSPERAYDRQWFRCLLYSSLQSLKETLEREGKAAYFAVLKTYLIDPAFALPAASGPGPAAPDVPTYTEVATKLGLRETDVRNYLTACRGALREILRARVREYVESESDVDGELDELLNG